VSGPGCVDPIRELVPFYLNGSLEAAEAEAVASHLAACSDCARDLDELSDLAVAIERHGAVDAGARHGAAGTARASRSPWLLAAAACLPVVALAAWAYLGHRGSRAEPGGRAGVEGTAGVVVLDLAGGLTRDQAEPPTLDIPHGAARIRIVFFIPVRPGAIYSAQIKGPEGRVVMPERAMGPLDALGRASFETPASGFDAEGSYKLEAYRDEPGKGRTTYQFAFVVRRPERN
jgi:Putative zinc-finger